MSSRFRCTRYMPAHGHPTTAPAPHIYNPRPSDFATNQRQTCSDREFVAKNYNNTDKMLWNCPEAREWYNKPSQPASFRKKDRAELPEAAKTNTHLIDNDIYKAEATKRQHKSSFSSVPTPYKAAKSYVVSANSAISNKALTETENRSETKKANSVNEDPYLYIGGECSLPNTLPSEYNEGNYLLEGKDISEDVALLNHASTGDGDNGASNISGGANNSSANIRADSINDVGKKNQFIGGYTEKELEKGLEFYNLPRTVVEKQLDYRENFSRINEKTSRLKENEKTLSSSVDNQILMSGTTNYRNVTIDPMCLKTEGQRNMEATLGTKFVRTLPLPLSVLDQNKQGPFIENGFAKSEVEKFTESIKMANRKNGGEYGIHSEVSGDAVYGKVNNADLHSSISQSEIAVPLVRNGIKFYDHSRDAKHEFSRIPPNYIAVTSAGANNNSADNKRSSSCLPSSHSNDESNKAFYSKCNGYRLLEESKNNNLHDAILYPVEISPAIITDIVAENDHTKNGQEKLANYVRNFVNPLQKARSNYELFLEVNPDSSTHFAERSSSVPYSYKYTNGTRGVRPVDHWRGPSDSRPLCYDDKIDMREITHHQNNDYHGMFDGLEGTQEHPHSLRMQYTTTYGRDFNSGRVRGQIDKIKELKDQITIRNPHYNNIIIENYSVDGTEKGVISEASTMRVDAADREAKDKHKFAKDLYRSAAERAIMSGHNNNPTTYVKAVEIALKQNAVQHDKYYGYENDSNGDNYLDSTGTMVVHGKNVRSEIDKLEKAATQFGLTPQKSREKESYELLDEIGKTAGVRNGYSSRITINKPFESTDELGNTARIRSSVGTNSNSSTFRRALSTVSRRYAEQDADILRIVRDRYKDRGAQSSAIWNMFDHHREF